MFVSPGTRLVAIESNATRRPSALIRAPNAEPPRMPGPTLCPFASAPVLSTLTRSVVPVSRSWTNTSGTPLVSAGTRLAAAESNVTSRPSSLMSGRRLLSSACPPDLPGRKGEHLRAVADAALDGLLDGRRLRDLDPDSAIAQVRQIKGLGPFAAELVVIRGANHPDALPHHEARLDAEIVERYGRATTLTQAAPAWRPYRTWAAVHLRALREQRIHEISGRSTIS